MFEPPLTFHHSDGSTSPRRTDLYRRGVFVVESKKLRLGTHTAGFDGAMLPADDGRPRFVVVVDVGDHI